VGNVPLEQVAIRFVDIGNMGYSMSYWLEEILNECLCRPRDRVRDGIVDLFKAMRVK
jgi:hypothetical protein